MKNSTLLLMVLLCISPSALALDGEYVVMGGFSTIVNAFTRLKLMFNDNEYKTMITAFVVVGMVSALLIKSAKGGLEFLETGKGQMGLGWLYLTIVGTLFYFGLVTQKGTIHIYDQSRNQYQAVSGIPDFLVATASVTNNVYQAFVDMSNRNSATTTRFTGEGTPIRMLLGVLNRNGAQYDSYLTDNIKTMWNQCSPVAETRGFDFRTLKSGSSVLDVVSALAPLRNQAVYTQWFSPSQPSGATITCDQAYLTLKSDLGNPSAFNARLQDVCTKNGYRVSDAAQFADCKGRMEDGFQTIFSASSLSLNSVMSNIVVSQAIADAMLQNNPEVAASLMANRAMINGGMADAITNPEWLSFIMSGVIAIILSITPLLLLLIFTPLIGKALTLLFGLWIFITTWQIADALLLQAGTDEILTAMNDIRSMGLGIDAVQMGPSSTMKAMAVMSSARETAVQIAMLVAALFGISAYGLGAFGQKAMGRLDRVTEDVSDKAFTAEGKGAQINAMNQGHATLRTAAEIGSIEQMSNARSYRDTADTLSSNMQIQSLGGSPGVAASRSAAVDAGRSAGAVKGFENGNPGGGYMPAEATAITSTQASVGDSRGRVEAAESASMSVADMSAMNTGVNTTLQTSDAVSTLQHGGGHLTSLGKQQIEVHGTERQAQVGHAGGMRDAANAANKSVDEFSRETTATGQISQHASGQGQLKAAGSLNNMLTRGVYTASAESDERLGHTNALHNAYDQNGGITSGVSETQTEGMTQDLSDKREQKANVGEIMAATGQTESKARETLSASRSAEQMGTLTGNNYSPAQMQANTAWSTQKGANVIKGEKIAYDQSNHSMPETAQRRGEIDAYAGFAEQGKFNTLSNTLGGDKPAADAIAGANTNLAVTRQDAQTMAEQGLLDPVQVNAIPENSVGNVHMGLRTGEDGTPVSSSSISSGNSTVIDNSFRNEHGQTLGSENSALQLLESPVAVAQLVTASETASPGSSPITYATEASRALSPVYKETVEQTKQHTTRAGVSVGTPAIGKLFGFNADAATNFEKANSHNNNTDLVTAMFQNRMAGYREEAGKEADHLNLSGDKRSQYINDNASARGAALFKTVKAGLIDMAGREAEVSDMPVRNTTQPQKAEASHQNEPTLFSRDGITSAQAYMQMRNSHVDGANNVDRQGADHTQSVTSTTPGQQTEYGRRSVPDSVHEPLSQPGSQQSATGKVVNSPAAQQTTVTQDNYPEAGHRNDYGRSSVPGNVHEPLSQPGSQQSATGKVVNSPAAQQTTVTQDNYPEAGHRNDYGRSSVPGNVHEPLSQPGSQQSANGKVVNSPATQQTTVAPVNNTDAGSNNEYNRSNVPGTGHEPMVQQPLNNGPASLNGQHQASVNMVNTSGRKEKPNGEETHAAGPTGDGNDEYSPHPPVKDNFTSADIPVNAKSDVNQNKIPK